MIIFSISAKLVAASTTDGGDGEKTREVLAFSLRGHYRRRTGLAERAGAANRITRSDRCVIKRHQPDIRSVTLSQFAGPNIRAPAPPWVASRRPGCGVMDLSRKCAPASRFAFTIHARCVVADSPPLVERNPHVNIPHP